MIFLLKKYVVDVQCTSFNQVLPQGMILFYLRKFYDEYDRCEVGIIKLVKYRILLVTNTSRSMGSMPERSSNLFTRMHLCLLLQFSLTHYSGVLVLQWLSAFVACCRTCNLNCIHHLPFSQGTQSALASNDPMSYAWLREICSRQNFLIAK